MSIDLKNLSYAPWSVRGGPEFSLHVEKADAHFIEVARSAFEIMMRRGWTATRWMPHDEHHGKWVVVSDWDDEIVQYQKWSDPFTALVEADAWYRENVEEKLHGTV